MRNNQIIIQKTTTLIAGKTNEKRKYCTPTKLNSGERPETNVSRDIEKKEYKCLIEKAISSKLMYLEEVTMTQETQKNIAEKIKWYLAQTTPRLSEERIKNLQIEIIKKKVYSVERNLWKITVTLNAKNMSEATIDTYIIAKILQNYENKISEIIKSDENSEMTATTLFETTIKECSVLITEPYKYALNLQSEINTKELLFPKSCTVKTENGKIIYLDTEAYPITCIKIIGQHSSRKKLLPLKLNKALFPPIARVNLTSIHQQQMNDDLLEIRNNYSKYKKQKYKELAKMTCKYTSPIRKCKFKILKNEASAVKKMF